jgi:hypothetical protein
MKNALLLHLLFLGYNTVLSQKLVSVLDDYRPLKNAISINHQKVWDDFHDEIPLHNRIIVPGFTWSWAGHSFDTLYVSQGRIAAEKQDVLVNIGVFEDLCDRGMGTDSSQSPISYKIRGFRGHHIVKIEWKNAGFFEDWSYQGNCDRHLQFQLWLYEKDSRVELHCPREMWYRHAGASLRQAEARLLLPEGQKIFAMTAQ